MTELKPCPFCGEDNASVSDRDYQNEFRVTCASCGAESLADTRSNAIAAWNRRAPDPIREEMAHWLERASQCEHVGRGLCPACKSGIESALARHEKDTDELAAPWHKLIREVFANHEPLSPEGIAQLQAGWKKSKAVAK